MTSRTIHLRSGFEVGERSREENWSGTLPFFPFAAGVNAIRDRERAVVQADFGVHGVLGDVAPAGKHATPPESVIMQICDICKKVVTGLRPGPPELQPLEACEECFQDLLCRFSAIEKRLAETKHQWRIEAITEWKMERSPEEQSA